MIEYAFATETHASVAKHLFPQEKENTAPPVKRRQLR